MSLLLEFFKEIAGQFPDDKSPSKNGSPVDAGDAPSSGGLIDPFAEGNEPEEPDGGPPPDSGRFLNPFAEDEPAAPETSAEPGKDDATFPAPAAGAEAQKIFEEAEALYKKKKYAEAAGKYQAAYKIASADQRGSLAFNIGQAYRLAKKFPYAVAWYEKALAIGVAGHDEKIEALLAEVQGKMQKKPERGPDGEDVGKAKMLFQQAEIAYGERDYAKAETLYKKAYACSGQDALMFNIAQSCRYGGKHADAKYWYSEYLKKVPNSEHKAVVEELLEELKKKVPDSPKSGDAGAAADVQKILDEAEALYKKRQYAEAAETFRSAYKSAGADQRGSLAFKIAQAYRLAKSYPFAAVWYQKALAIGGSGATEFREQIEELLAEVQGEMKTNPEKGPDGKDVGEAKMLYQEAEIAYAERDYAKAEALYKQSYARSNQAAICFNIAQSCRLGGKHADAKYWYRQYLKKVPKSPHKTLIEEELLVELKKKAPDPPKKGSQDDAKAKFEQAESFYKEGKFSEAADLYVEVYYDPAVASVRGEMAFNMGQCMRKDGNATSAVEWYKKALECLPKKHAKRKDIPGLIAELTGEKVAPP